MQFAFTEEQQMIRSTAEAFLRECSDSAAIRAAMDTEQGYDASLWQQICQEMVWQAIIIPEEYDGLGLGYVELVAILEQMGRFQLCAPFFSSVCLATNALLAAANEEQKSLWLPKIAAGETRATLAWQGSKGSDSVTASLTGATGIPDSYRISGEYHYVVDGHTAELLIVATRDTDDRIQLFAVPADSPGIERSWTPTLDQTRKLALLKFNQVEVTQAQQLSTSGTSGTSGTNDSNAQTLESILDLARVCLAAEQLGGAQQALDLAVAYCADRQQFNRPIASFQAIKHKAADMMVRAEVSRSAVYYAACIADRTLTAADTPSDWEELPEAASIAKSRCSDAFFRNSGDAIQMHGGVGFTWEYDIQLYFKRAKASELFLGNSAYHRERVAAMLLDNPSGESLS